MKQSMVLKKSKLDRLKKSFDNLTVNFSELPDLSLEGLGLVFNTQLGLTSLESMVPEANSMIQFDID